MPVKELNTPEEPATLITTDVRCRPAGLGILSIRLPLPVQGALDPPHIGLRLRVEFHTLTPCPTPACCSSRRLALSIIIRSPQYGHFLGREDGTSSFR